MVQEPRVKVASPRPVMAWVKVLWPVTWKQERWKGLVMVQVRPPVLYEKVTLVPSWTRSRSTERVMLGGGVSPPPPPPSSPPAGGVTVTVRLACVLPLPEQVMVKAVVWVRFVMPWEPERFFEPVHWPFEGLADAVQDVAFCEDQVRVEPPPLVTLVGFAFKVTVGGGVAETLTVA